MSRAAEPKPEYIPYDLPGLGVPAGSYLVRRPHEPGRPAAIVRYLTPAELVGIEVALSHAAEPHQHPSKPLRPRLEVVR